MERLRAPFQLSLTPRSLPLPHLMRDGAHIARAQAHNVKWRQIALQRLRGIGLKVIDSAANFVLPEFPNQLGTQRGGSPTHSCRRAG